MTKARRELEFAKQHPSCSCDVCGPYGHTFYACHEAAEKAIRAFLCFYNHEPEETHDPKLFLESRDLKRLVTLAAADVSSFDNCMEAAIAVMDYSFSREPTGSELDEALRLAEQIVVFVASQLPEDVLR